MLLTSLAASLSTAMLVHHAPSLPGAVSSATIRSAVVTPSRIAPALDAAARLIALLDTRASVPIDRAPVTDDATLLALATIDSLQASMRLVDGIVRVPQRAASTTIERPRPVRRGTPQASAVDLDGCGCTLSAAQGYLATGPSFWLPEAQRGTPVAFEVETADGIAAFSIAHGTPQATILAEIQAACAPIHVTAVLAPENDRRIELTYTGCAFDFFDVELIVRQLAVPGVDHQPRLFSEPNESTPLRALEMRTDGPTGRSYQARGDVDCNLQRDFDDLIAVLAHWGESAPAYEFTGDGVIDEDEVAYLLERWGSIRSPDLYVDATAPPGGDGTSWDTAFRHLRDALDSIKLDPNPGFTRRYSGDVVVRVAHGTYRPDRTEQTPRGSGDTGDRFGVPEGTHLIGGFAGRGAPDPDLNDPAQFETILSGDLLDNDGPDGANRGDNSWIVARLVGSRLTGVTVRGATRIAIADYDPLGHPSTLRTVRVVDNHTMFTPVWFNERDRVIECTFQDNVGGDGGALVIGDGGLVERSTFIGNRGDARGGAIIATSADVMISNSIFIGNESPDGSAIQTTGAFVTSCLFTEHDTDAIISGPARLLNDIFWMNRAPLANALGDPPLFAHCIVPEPTPGNGNVVADPQWIDPANGDFALAAGSPAIDAGETSRHPIGFPVDAAGAPRVVNDPEAPDAGIPRETDAIIDIGPLERGG